LEVWHGEFLEIQATFRKPALKALIYFMLRKSRIHIGQQSRFSLGIQARCASGVPRTDSKSRKPTSEGIGFGRTQTQWNSLRGRSPKQNTNMKTTETAAPKLDTNRYYQAPTHDEIALAAFLQWEREGRQPGREMYYWCEAEAQLRSIRRKKAEIAAAQAALPWPRPSRAAQIKKAGATVVRRRTTAATRSTVPKNGATKTVVALKSSAPKARARRTA
jgi:hypothetical protein